jgi:surface polysaccharide O-acyltransferase-like enzyme
MEERTSSAEATEIGSVNGGTSYHVRDLGVWAIVITGECQVSNDEISSRIEILRFPLIIGVVFIHTYGMSVHIGHGSIGATHASAWVEFVRVFISQGVARIAVPLFFLSSGYLFFLGGWSQKKYVSKLKRRFHTLLIPFLFWNIITLVIHAVGESVPNIKIYIANTIWPPVHSFSLFNYINALFGITQYPISYQFWFIRDLITLVILVPVINLFLARKSALLFVTVLFCMWFISVWPIPWPWVDAVFFFSLGAYLSRSAKNVACLDKLGPWISVIFLGLLVLNTVLSDRLLYIHNAVIVFGVPSLWWLTSLVVRMAMLKSLLIRLSGVSFFVFAAHEPLLTIILKISYKLLSPTSDAMILALYFLIPICLITVLVMLHHYLLKTMPSFLGFITGMVNRPYKYCVEEPVLVQRY